jgi:hypothetical protein
VPLQKRIVLGSNEWQLLQHLDFQRIDFVMEMERVRVICDAEVVSIGRSSARNVDHAQRRK